MKKEMIILMLEHYGNESNWKSIEYYYNVDSIWYQAIWFQSWYLDLGQFLYQYDIGIKLEFPEWRHDCLRFIWSGVTQTYESTTLIS